MDVNSLNLCEIMRDLVMPRCFGYVFIESMRDYAGFSYASLIQLCFVRFGSFRICSYSWLCLLYYINDTILYKE